MNRTLCRREHTARTPLKAIVRSESLRALAVRDVFQTDDVGAVFQLDGHPGRIALLPRLENALGLGSVFKL